MSSTEGVEELSGLGPIYVDATVLGTVLYQLVVGRPMLRSRDGAGESRSDVRGYLTGDMQVLYPLFESQRLATLHLDDGRCWDFILQAPDGRASSAGRGLFRPPSTRVKGPQLA